ncbi:hypothetical protein FI667_g11715, partial [Globisporangium splendens]
MALLLEDDDTLQAALAFIDACSDESASDHSESHSELARSLASSPVNSSSRQHNEKSTSARANILYSSSIDSLFDGTTPFVLRFQPPRKQRRQEVVQLQDKLKARAANTKAVNRYRKRTKAEILSLRDQVVHLKAHLRDLVERDPHSVKSLVAWMDANASAKSTMRDLIEGPQRSNLVSAARIAFAEYCKLQQSRRLNHELKHALATHVRFNTVLEHIFRIPFTNNSKNADDSENDTHQLEPMSNDVVVFKRLLQYLKDVVYSNAAAVSGLISSTNDTNVAFSNTVVKQDPIVGQIFEFTSNAPLSCTVQHAGARLWKHLDAFVGNQNLGRARTQTPYGTETSCGRQFATQYGSSMGDIHVNGISTVRRFVDHRKRVVIAYTSLLSPVSTDAVYREHGWLILTDVGDPRSSSPMTLFQTCYQLYLDGGYPESGLAPEVSRIHNVIMNTQGMRMRSHQLHIQRVLLQELDLVPVSSPMYVWLPNEWSHETQQGTPQKV